MLFAGCRTENQMFLPLKGKMDPDTRSLIWQLLDSTWVLSTCTYFLTSHGKCYFLLAQYILGMKIFMVLVVVVIKEKNKAQKNQGGVSPHCFNNSKHFFFLLFVASGLLWIILIKQWINTNENKIIWEKKMLNWEAWLQVS